MLHIGNIANNAYNNAKIQRRIGIEADVCCYDYFHIMGCPEWEDADFEGDVGDPFFPDWWAVDLKGLPSPGVVRAGAPANVPAVSHRSAAGRQAARPTLRRQLRFELWLRCRSTRSARSPRR